MNHEAAILIVEDSPIIMEVHVAMIRLMGFEPHCAVNGTQAHKLFQDHIYDLVLMDVGLPDTDGATLTEWFRMTEKLQQRPATTIVAITAFMLDEVSDRCLQAGMNAVYAKPIQQEVLQRVVHQALKLPESIAV